MNKTALWTFGILVGALALGDWFVTDTPAGGDEARIPPLTVNGVDVSAVLREVETKAGKEQHAFLTLSGNGTGKVSVEYCTITYPGAMSRVAGPLPAIVWRKDIELDTADSRSIDLGAIDTRTKESWELRATTDGKKYFHLLGSGTSTFEGFVEVVPAPNGAPKTPNQ